jgi:hypothetical protein
MGFTSHVFRTLQKHDGEASMRPTSALSPVIMSLYMSIVECHSPMIHCAKSSGSGASVSLVHHLPPARRPEAGRIASASAPCLFDMWVYIYCIGWLSHAQY